MNRFYFYPISLALVFLLSYHPTQGQSWFNSSFTYDLTDNTNAYKRHECGGALLNIGGEPVGVIVGGRGSRQKAILYYLDRGFIDVTSKAPYEIHHVQGAVYNGTTVVIGMGFQGGFPNETPNPNILAYHSDKDSWATLGTIPLARQRGSAASVIDGDWMYFFSGLTEGHTGGWVDWVDRFNLVTKVWETLPSAPRARDHSFAIQEGNKVYLVGGRRSDADDAGLHAHMVNEVDVFDLSTLTWESSPMSIPTSRAGALVASRINASSELEIALWGGEASSGVLSSGDLLNLTKLSSSSIPNLATPRHATVIFTHPASGDLYTMGGAYFGGWENEITSNNYTQRFGLPTAFPVEWLNVDAQNEKTGIEITWEVSEHSVDHYRIERRSKGSLWEVVGSVSSTGDGENTYQFTDGTSIQGSVVNYRIVSTDFDGSVSYSRVMELGVDANLFAYPNPVRANGGSIQFSIKADRLELMDAKGAVLASVEHSSSLGLNSGIAPGLYFFRVFDKSQMIYTRKILIE